MILNQGLKTPALKVITVKYLNNIPQQEHWVIVQERMVSFEGGHGYGTQTEHFLEYTAYINQTQWEEDVKLKTLKGEKIAALRVVPANIEVKVSVQGFSNYPLNLRNGDIA